MPENSPLPLKVIHYLWRSVFTRIIFGIVFLFFIFNTTDGVFWLTFILISIFLIFKKLPIFLKQTRKIKVTQLFLVYGILSLFSTQLAGTGLPQFFDTVRLPQHETTIPFVDDDGMIYVYSKSFMRVSKYNQDGTLLFSRHRPVSLGGRSQIFLLLFPEGDVLIICRKNRETRLILDRNLEIVGRDRNLCDPQKTANFDRISDPLYLYDQLNLTRFSIGRSNVSPSIICDGSIVSIFFGFLFPPPMVSFGISIFALAALFIFRRIEREKS